MAIGRRNQEPTRCPGCGCATAEMLAAGRRTCAVCGGPIEYVTQTRALNCPGCGYDVTQTLTDGIDTCPECGGHVSVSGCIDDRQWKLQHRNTTRLVFAIFWPVLAGMASVAIAYALPSSLSNMLVTAIVVGVVASVVLPPWCFLFVLFFGSSSYDAPQARRTGVPARLAHAFGVACRAFASLLLSGVIALVWGVGAGAFGAVVGQLAMYMLFG